MTVYCTDEFGIVFSLGSGNWNTTMLQNCVSAPLEPYSLVSHLSPLSFHSRHVPLLCSFLPFMGSCDMVNYSQIKYTNSIISNEVHKLGMGINVAIGCSCRVTVMHSQLLVHPLDKLFLSFVVQP